MATPLRICALLAVSLLALTALAGCGDDQPAGRQSLGDRSARGSTGPAGDLTTVRPCKVSVLLSGAMHRRLEGTGRAIYDNDTGPHAFYQFTSGDISVQVYSAGPQFTASVVISTKSGSFTSEAGSRGLHVSTTGKWAQVDADTVGPDEGSDEGSDESSGGTSDGGPEEGSDGVHVEATYTCA
jgi:hypothetical protein